MLLFLQQAKPLLDANNVKQLADPSLGDAYDAEEMNILKEILLRREREKHFLEKEVEGYRQMVLGNEQSDSDVQDVADTLACDSTLYLSEDPILTLHQINDFIEKPKVKILDDSSEHEVSPFKSLNQTIAFGKELAIPVLAEDDESLKQEDMYEHTSGNKASHECREKNAKRENDKEKRSRAGGHCSSKKEEMISKKEKRTKG